MHGVNSGFVFLSFGFCIGTSDWLLCSSGRLKGGLDGRSREGAREEALDSFPGLYQLFSCNQSVILPLATVGEDSGEISLTSFIRFSRPLYRRSDARS